jgi:16S rRNA (guanine527-N7)-methyltransferase
MGNDLIEKYAHTPASVLILLLSILKYSWHHMEHPQESPNAHIAALARHFALPNAAWSQLDRFVALLLKWNQVYNLTALREEADVWSHHIADCLAVVAPLQRQLARMDLADADVLDVGAGGGLPGVVLAIACPQLRITCVDAVGKKAAFVQQTAGALGLSNLRGVHSRVEALSARDQPPLGFAFVTSRAFAALPDFVRLTEPWLFHVERGAPVAGVWMAMKGKSPDAEIAALPQSVRVGQVEPLSVPGLHEERCIVWLDRNSPSA